MKTLLTARKFRSLAQRRRYLRNLMKRKGRKEVQRMALPVQRAVAEESRSYLDCLEDEPTRKSLRIYFQNVNTLKVGSERKETEESFRKLSMAGTSLVFLSEVNKNMELEEVAKKVEEVVSAGMPGARCRGGGNKYYKAQSWVKPGGELVVVGRHIEDHVSDVMVDDMGRWLKLQFNTETKVFVFYCVYVPNKNNSGGVTTVARQIRCALDDQGVLADWKENFYEELRKDVAAELKKGREVVMGGDFNEEVKEGGLMTETFVKLGLVNLFQELMGEVPPTRRGGKRTIDHVWVSPGMMDIVGAAGLVGVDKVFATDHMGMFVDLKVGEFDYVREEDSRPPRYLKSKNVKNAARYLGRVKKNVRRNKLSRAVDRLHYRVTSGRLDDKVRIKKDLDNIDRAFQGILMRGEASLKPSQGESVSEALWRLKRRRKYWRMILYQRRNQTDEGLRRVWAGHVRENLRRPRREIRRELESAQEEVLKYYADRSARRDQILRECSEKAGAKGDKEVEKAVTEMRASEKRNREFRFLRKVLKPRNYGVEPEVDVPEEVEDVEEMWEMLKRRREIPSRWAKVRGRKEVEPVLVEWNRRHFEQASESPMAGETWERLLDVNREDNEVDQILEGDLSGVPMDVQECVEWVAELKRKEIIETELKVTEEAFRKFIQKVKESKSSSPSGRHYGHYKVMLEEEELVRIAFRIVETALAAGVVLERWECVHQIQILKDAPQTRVHRFRNITLVEADLMFVMKHVWARTLAKNIQMYDCLNQAQYARRGQVAQTSVLNKRVSYDLQLTLREEAFQADNDATDCYDRIIHNIAVVASMRMGLSKRGGRFLKEQLQKFQYHIVLGGRPSRESFRDSLLSRVHGTGQGTGWSPIIWSVVSDVIISVMDRCQPGQYFVSPDGSLVSEQTIDAFVDDSNLSVNEAGVQKYNDRHEEDLSLVEASKKAYQGYGRYLLISGGRLALEKCKFYWLNPVRRGFRYYFSVREEQDLCFREGFSGDETRLRQLQANEPHKILGIWIEPCGGQGKQIEKMKGSVVSWIARMDAWRVAGHMRMLSYKTSLWPALKYPLGVSQLTEKGAKEVMAPLMPVLKNACGLGSKFSEALLKLPLRYGGYGVHQMEIVMIMEQAKMLMSAVRMGGNTGAKVKSLVEYHQMESGVAESILENGGETEFLMTETWVKRLIRGLRKVGLKVRMSHWKPDSRAGVTMMQYLRERESDERILMKLNLCRMSYQVVCVDEVYDIDGELSRGGVTMTHSRSTLNWPTTKVPKRWEKWWWDELAKRLPSRKREITWWYRRPKAMLSMSGKYMRTGGRTYLMKSSRVRSGNYAWRVVDNCPEKVEVPGRLRIGARGKVVARSAKVRIRWEDGERSKGFDAYPWRSEELEEVSVLLQGGVPKLYCDASVKGDWKAVAMWLGTEEKGGRIFVKKVEGLPHDSGRGELAGPVLLLRALVWLQIVEKRVYKVEMKLDNMEVVGLCQKEGFSQLPSKVCSRNADLKMQLEGLMRKYKGEVTVSYVPAHQDEKCPYEELPFDGQRNADCDREARRVVGEMDKGRDEVRHFHEDTVVMLWSDTGGVTEDPYAWWAAKLAREVVPRRLKMAGGVFGMVDWQLHGRILAKVDHVARIGVQKMVWGELPCMQRLRRNGKRQDDGCPLCGQVDDQGHFYRCRKVRGGEVAKRIMGNLGSRLRERGTSPVVAMWIMKMMEGVVPPLEDMGRLRLTMLVRKCHQDQSRVGWENFLCGRLAKGCVRLQEWWEFEVGRPESGRSRDATETIVQAMANCLVFRHELWRARCTEVLTKERPTREKLLLEEIGRLRDRVEEVGAADRAMFEESAIPKGGDELERMKEWVRAVTGSMERMRNRSEDQSCDLRSYFGRRWEGSERGEEAHRRRGRTE